MRYAMKSWSIMLSLVFFVSVQSFAETLNVVDIDVKRGTISNQDLAVLSKLEQKGSSAQNNNWNTYKEAAPDGRRFAGDFWFESPSIKGKDWSSIIIKTNTLGETPPQQTWRVYLRDFSKGRWYKVGDNQDAQSWVWYQKDFVVEGNISRFINKSGKIRLRYSSNNAKDVSDIDFLQIELVSDGGPVEPTPPVQPTPTVKPNPTVTPGPTVKPTPQPTISPDPTVPPEPTVLPTPEPTVVPTPTPDPSAMRDISLKSSITKVQPMTGIVLWADSHNGSVLKNDDQYVQLEYAYVKPSDVVIGDNRYDWSSLENLLEDVRTRGKQAILRWYYVYPGSRQTAVPKYIKDYGDYKETVANSEGKATGFPDWSHPELKQAHKDFYTAFAARYDNDPRIAFLQIGFGLWGEYHIYDPSVKLGQNFPSKAYQTEFLKHMSAQFKNLHWSISIDAGDKGNTPIAGNQQLLGLNFGMFDDSFMHKEHADYNADMWRVFGFAQRYKNSPHGGELSYYTNADQKNVLNVGGMHGRTYEELSRQYHITYMIGNDQPQYQKPARIKSAGMANGYKFTVTSFKASDSASRVTVKNTGIAPIYYDAYVTVNGVRSGASLKGLLPNQQKEFSVSAGGRNPSLSIESDRLVSGQEIQYNADL